MSDLTPAAIRAARDRLGLSQTAFAARLGVSPQAVTMWELDKRTPTGLYADALREAIAALDVSREEPGMTEQDAALLRKAAEQVVNTWQAAQEHRAFGSWHKPLDGVMDRHDSTMSDLAHRLSFIADQGD